MVGPAEQRAERSASSDSTEKVVALEHAAERSSEHSTYSACAHTSEKARAITSVHSASAFGSDGRGGSDGEPARKSATQRVGSGWRTRSRKTRHCVASASTP